MVAPGVRRFVAALQRFERHTPEQKLRWLLAFLQRDLDALYPEERVALGYDLAGLALSGADMALVRHGADAVADTVLRKYQGDIRRGLQAVLDGQPWELPGVPVLTRTDSTFRITVHGDEQAGGLLVGIAHVLVAAGDRLRMCASDRQGEGCGQMFVRTRRQTFCSLTCSQQARNLRKKLRAATEPLTTPAKKKGRR